MKRGSLIYQSYVSILKRELICAMGCTEPIAVAYCAAVARAALGEIPDRIEIAASGNIIKNVKSVVVPNTEGGRGIEVAAAVGVLGGDERAGLEVLSAVTKNTRNALPSYIQATPIFTVPLMSNHLLDIIVTVYRGNRYAKAHIVDEHTNLVLVECDNHIIFEQSIDHSQTRPDETPDYTLLTVKDIYDFASSCELEDIKDILDQQIACNCAIAAEGLRHDYGANIGKLLLKINGEDVRANAKAWAAAGSDARMNGCELPVVINSGSGNQGLAASLPVIQYAKARNASMDLLYRALLVSNLVTLHEKASIGRLSAYCGAVSAGAGAGAGIAYLCGGTYEDIANTITNALAITSGIVCDGAKSSCAAKIAVAVEAGLFGYEMQKNGKVFSAGDGLVAEDVEASIENFGRLGKIGMQETDREIISIMTGQ